MVSTNSEAPLLCIVWVGKKKLAAMVTDIINAATLLWLTFSLIEEQSKVIVHDKWRYILWQKNA